MAKLICLAYLYTFEGAISNIEYNQLLKEIENNL